MIECAEENSKINSVKLGYKNSTYTDLELGDGYSLKLSGETANDEQTSYLKLKAHGKISREYNDWIFEPNFKI